MQLSARILTTTALAVLIVTVAFVAGSVRTPDVNAAAGSIAVINVGSCVTSDLDVLDKGDCNDHYKNYLFENAGIKDAIEVDPDELYATYAYDPVTADDPAPRGILKDSDLLKISITDKDRDKRTGVLIRDLDTDYELDDNGKISKIKAIGVADDGTDVYLTDPAAAAEIGIINDAIQESIGKDNKIPKIEGKTGVNTGEIDSSGTRTVRFSSFPGVSDSEYKPVAPDGVVKFFGTKGNEFMDLEDYVTLDEDIVSGDTNIPPALRLILNVPSNTEIKIQFIYYETSEIDYIMGDQECNGNGKLNQAACTKDEIGDPEDPNDNASFDLKASGDGDSNTQQLYLRETGRFTGVFEGYLRLTDGDGDGSGKNWGRPVRDAGSDTQDGAAVLGVESGPVTITYKDTDAVTRTFEVLVDTEAPIIEIETPVHESRSDDDKPDFLGRINDGVSGLAADSFVLYVDNSDDQSNDDTILDIKADDVASKDGEPMQLSRDYRSKSFGPFGVQEAHDLYFDEDDKTKPDDDGYDTEDGKRLSIEADEFDNGDADAVFEDDLKIELLEDDGNEFSGDFNHQIDFQALVRDLAGNIGFSDSDPDHPRFINDLGTESAKRKIPNVLGYYSAHIVYLDEVDPYIDEDKTVTGFFGIEDKKLTRDSSSVMVVFDNSVDEESIDTGTFSVQLEEDTDAEEITEVDVDGKLVFLKLATKLKSDAKPIISIAEGNSVLDKAGNETRHGETVIDPSDSKQTTVKANDGILPTLTVELSDGTGTGTGAEGPSRLTGKTIKIRVTADEAISGAPRLTVICSELEWGDDNKKGLSDLTAARQGAFSTNPAGPNEGNCKSKEDRQINHPLMLSRPGSAWEYEWRNLGSASSETHLSDGKLTAIIWARDRSSYEFHEKKDGTRYNWNAETAEFTYDTSLLSPRLPTGGDIEPDPDSEDVNEPRPFILIDFFEPTTVALTALSVNGEDVLGSVDRVQHNEFLYWPQSLDYGKHEVLFSARDAAGNELEDDIFSFTVTARDSFVISLIAGWNAISFPARPVDTSLESVFPDNSVDRVIGWNAEKSNSPWSIATKIEGVWMTSEEFAPLTDVGTRYGYWVHSAGFVDISVPLVGPLNRETDPAPELGHIPTVPGWNFVAVVDAEGDQTEKDFGESLAWRDTNSGGKYVNKVIEAKDYMPGFKRAYTWNAIEGHYKILRASDPMVIGSGVWVYFPDDDNEAVAP